MKTRLTLFVLALWCLLASIGVLCQEETSCTDPTGIMISPSNNQLVPIAMDEVVSYTCTVRAGQRADWVFLGIQVSIESQSSISFLAGIGINMTFGTGPTSNIAYIAISRMGREFYSNVDLTIACAEFDTSSISIRTGCVYLIRTFEIPSEVQNLRFNHFPGNLTRLVLTWDPPANTLTDPDDPVSTSYTVKVSGDTHNFTVVTPLTTFEFNDDPNTECAEHHFIVYASNGAGKGAESSLNETIPISPDTDALSAQLRVNRVIMGSTITVEVSFPRALICSDNFPLSKYRINVVGTLSTSFSANDSRILGREQITLSTSSSAIMPNTAYSLTVSACILVTCRDSLPVDFNTSDVQSASIMFFESNVFLSCSFATDTQAQGCVFTFTAGPNITEDFTITLPASSSCEQILNMEGVYTSIVARDLEADGSRGSLAIVPVRDRTSSVEEFMASTGCTPPVFGLSAGGIAGIVVAIVAVVIIAIIVVLVISICCARSKARDKVDGITVDCKECEPLVQKPPNTARGPPPPNRVEADSDNRDEVDSAEIELGDRSQGEPGLFQFNLNRGRKTGKIVMDMNMLNRLRNSATQRNDNRAELEFLVSN